MSKKILIAYYSHSGNTRTIANVIQKITNSNLFEISPQQPYTENYNQCVQQARKEISSGYKPELKTEVENIAQYDTIFIGSPNWCSTIAPPVTTFLSNNNLSGKTIAPFITHGGGGIGRIISDIKKLAQNATITKELYLNGSSAKNAQNNVEKWLNEINVT
jgi:flavodoxin